MDGTEPEIRDFQDQKWYEVSKYLSISNYVWTPNYWFMNADRYEGLDADGKKAIDEAVAETTACYRGELGSVYERIIAELEGLGVAVNTVEQAPFREMVGPVYEEFGAEWGADFVEKVRAAVAR